MRPRFSRSGRLDALGHGSQVTIQPGESITVDFGYVRAPLGALGAWGKSTAPSSPVHLSDNGQDFSEVGRITTGDGDADSFWWRSTTARYFRLTVHEASASEGAVVDELKLRILNKDRMPIGAVQGNMLVGERTIQAMAEAFTVSAGLTLPERLMAVVGGRPISGRRQAEAGLICGSPRLQDAGVSLSQFAGGRARASGGGTTARPGSGARSAPSVCRWHADSSAPAGRSSQGRHRHVDDTSSVQAWRRLSRLVRTPHFVGGWEVSGGRSSSASAPPPCESGPSASPAVWLRNVHEGFSPRLVSFCCGGHALHPSELAPAALSPD